MSLMGYVKKEGASWYYHTELGRHPITGKRQRKRKRGFKTKRDAEKALAIIEADIYKGNYFEPSTALFKDHIENWYRSKRNNINIHTAETYEGYINNRIIPSLGHIQLSKLTPFLLQNYVNELKEEGLASATVKKVYNILNRIIKLANIKTIRFHDLRHTHATMLLAQGVHAKVISERLGHSNIKTTLEIYSHVLPSMQEESANKIDALFAK